MNRQIENYINSIHRFRNPVTDKNEYDFYGDGQGDFEKIGNFASKEIVENYIYYLEEQKRWAKEYLKTL